jgi:transcriptional regulator with XRE-family HTH domain
MLTDLQIAKNSFNNWAERGTIPSGDVIVKIADYFNVSTDYLLGKTDAKNPPAETEGLIFHIKDDNLRAEVDELVSIYLSLDNAGRTLVLAKAIEESRIQAACDAAKQINETA